MAAGKSFGRSKIGLRPLPGHSFLLKALISQSSSPYLASTVRRRIDLNQRQAVISLSGCLVSAGSHEILLADRSARSSPWIANLIVSETPLTMAFSS
jgi:hypothetical protein